MVAEAYKIWASFPSSPKYILNELKIQVLGPGRGLFWGSFKQGGKGLGELRPTRRRGRGPCGHLQGIARRKGPEAKVFEEQCRSKLGSQRGKQWK